MEQVLDKGYVRLLDAMGDDLTVVNAARVSFHKESHEFSGKDERLLRYLWRNGHTSPFRHAFLSFEVKAPLIVARQWWKHVVGSDHTMDAWNEESRRYVQEEPEFYIPDADAWRRRPPDGIKQGSGDPLDGEEGDALTRLFEESVARGVADYERALASNVAPEQARLFLPAYAMYIHWRWSASLQSVGHFVKLRLDSHAQYEIREYARVIAELSAAHFPRSLAAILEGDAPG